MKLLLSGTLIALLLVSVTAHAQIYSDIDVGGGANGSVDGSADADASVTVDNDASVGMDRATSSDETSNNDTSVGVTPDAGASISFTQREAARVSLDAESAELAASAVASSEDLSVYATSKLKRDAALKRIDASSERVMLSYRKTARFLGFIPTGITVSATVTNDGEVDIDYPWYRFLFAAEHDADAEARLEAQVREILAAQANAEAGFSVTTEAELIDRLYLALSGSADAAASVGTQ